MNVWTSSGLKFHTVEVILYRPNRLRFRHDKIIHERFHSFLKKSHHRDWVAAENFALGIPVKFREFSTFPLLSLDDVNDLTPSHFSS